jgi:hypothetical protein
MPKGDAFERKVQRITKSDIDVGYPAFLFPQDVLKLLRAQHRATVRMVKRESENHPHSTLYRDCLLDKLNARAK